MLRQSEPTGSFRNMLNDHPPFSAALLDSMTDAQKAHFLTLLFISAKGYLPHDAETLVWALNAAAKS